MLFKVVSFNGLDQMASVVSVYAFDDATQRYLPPALERRFFSSSRKDQQARDRYVADMLATYTPSVLRYMEATDDWNDADPVERDRRGL